MQTLHLLDTIAWIVYLLSNSVETYYLSFSWGSFSFLSFFSLFFFLTCFSFLLFRSVLLV